MARRVSHGRIGILFAASVWAAVVLSAAGLQAGPPAEAKTDPARAEMLETEITRYDPRTLVVRSAFRVSEATHRWFTLYTQIQFVDQSFLKRADGRDFLKLWGDIFTPRNDPAEYTECRLGLTHAELENTANLPAGTRTILFVSNHLWDKKQKKYIGHGWPARAPLIVTTDKRGKITKAQTFTAPPPPVADNDAYKEVDGKVCTLTLVHLQPKEGLEVAETRTPRDQAVYRLYLKAQQATLGSTAVGHFFGTIDTAAKARELVELGLPKSLVIKDEKQFDAIVAELKKIPRWQAEDWMKAGRPQWYGLTVTEEPGLGWHVKVLVYWYYDYGVFGHRHLVQRHYRITRGGRIGMDEKIILLGPAPPYGIPPGWRPEFGWTPPAPAPKPKPGEPVVGRPPSPSGPDNPYIAYQTQNAAIQKALLDGHYDVIPSRIKVTETTKKFPDIKQED